MAWQSFWSPGSARFRRHWDSPNSFTLWWTNILLWKITIFNGKTHYKWAIFNCYVSSPEGKGMWNLGNDDPDPARKVESTIDRCGYLIYLETQHALMDDQMTRFCTQIPPLAEIQLWVCPPPSCVHLEHLWNTCGTLGYLDIPLKVTGREAVQWRHVCYWYSFGVIICGSLKHPIHGSFTERIARAAMDLLDNQDAIKKTVRYYKSIVVL